MNPFASTAAARPASSTSAQHRVPSYRFLSECGPRRGRTSAAGASGREGDGMRLLGWRRGRSDHGMTTAEYAVGTVAACGFGGVLYKVVTSDTVMHLIENAITHALHFFF